MSELSQRMMVTGGNITALTEQLQSEGLIERCSDPVDRRVTRVSLTPTGRKRFSEMASAHQHWVGELTKSLSREDAIQLFELLGKLKLSVQSVQTDEAKSQ